MDSNTSVGVPARSGFGLFIPPQKKGEEEFLVCFFGLLDERFRETSSILPKKHRVGSNS